MFELHYSSFFSLLTCTNSTTTFDAVHMTRLVCLTLTKHEYINIAWAVLKHVVLSCLKSKQYIFKSTKSADIFLYKDISCMYIPQCKWVIEAIQMGEVGHCLSKNICIISQQICTLESLNPHSFLEKPLTCSICPPIEAITSASIFLPFVLYLLAHIVVGGFWETKHLILPSAFQKKNTDSYVQYSKISNLDLYK